jgi:hypothetical protein
MAMVVSVAASRAAASAAGQKRARNNVNVVTASKAAAEAAQKKNDDQSAEQNDDGTPLSNDGTPLKKIHTTDFLNETAHSWLRDHEIPIRDGSHCKKGDIVICSVNQNWSDPCELGKVVKFVAGKGQKLPAGHRDGDYANVFVLSYKKQKLTGKKPLKGECQCLFFS